MGTGKSIGLLGITSYCQNAWAAWALGTRVSSTSIACETSMAINPILGQFVRKAAEGQVLSTRRTSRYSISIGGITNLEEHQHGLGLLKKGII
jgi:hypothetical protein